MVLTVDGQAVLVDGRLYQKQMQIENETINSYSINYININLKAAALFRAGLVFLTSGLCKSRPQIVHT